MCFWPYWPVTTCAELFDIPGIFTLVRACMSHRVLPSATVFGSKMVASPSLPVPGWRCCSEAASGTFLDLLNGRSTSILVAALISLDHGRDRPAVDERLDIDRDVLIRHALDQMAHGDLDRARAVGSGVRCGRLAPAAIEQRRRRCHARCGWHSLLATNPCEHLDA